MTTTSLQKQYWTLKNFIYNCLVAIYDTLHLHYFTKNKANKKITHKRDMNVYADFSSSNGVYHFNVSVVQYNNNIIC